MDTNHVKFTMQNFLGDFSMVKESNDSIVKMLSLPDSSFNDLMHDVINDIHRRNGEEYDKTDKKMRKKLFKLKEDKFKNLVSDVLHVYNLRYNANVNDSIEDIKKILTVLKLEEDLINEENKDFKYKLFLDYLKNRYSEDKIVAYMYNFNQKKIDQQFDNSIEILFNYELLVDKIDKSKYSGLKQYNIYKKTIEIYKKIEDNKVRKELLQNEFFNIFKLIIKNRYVFEEDKLKITVNNLIDLLQDYKENKIDSLKEILCNIRNECIKIKYLKEKKIDKLHTFINKEEITENDLLEIISTIKIILAEIKEKHF